MKREELIAKVTTFWYSKPLIILHLLLKKIGIKTKFKLGKVEIGDVVQDLTIG